MKQELDLTKLAEECRQYIECDTARISKYSDTMYFIIGFNRNTKDDPGIILNENNQEINYDYVNELSIAKGTTKKDLIKSIKEYKKLCSMSWPEYFKKYINPKININGK